MKNLNRAHVAALQAVRQHPLLMSPLLLEYLLRGEIIGRMAEKGLLDSPHHGALADVCGPSVAENIAEVLAAGYIARGGGFYPALKITPAGEAALDAAMALEA